jgi:hypothetical protein
VNSKTNHLAIVVSAIVYFLIGGAWFGFLFSSAWIQAVGKSMEEIQKTTLPPAALYTLALVAALVLNYGLNWILQRAGKQGVVEGVKVAIALWIGIVATTVGPIFMFSGSSLRLFAIDAGYPLVAMVISGAIVGGWTKKSSQPLAKAGVAGS